MKSVMASIILFAASCVRAENFMVTLGIGGLKYTPDSVNANAGDTIEFVVTGTHDITEADFSSPCQYNGGAWSGVAPQPNFVITVADSSPRFFYCSIEDHCIAGMVFALNPTGSETFASFQSAAEAFTGTAQTPSGGETGGTSGPVPSGSSSSSSPPATTSSSAPPPVASSSSSSEETSSTSSSTEESSTSTAASPTLTASTTSSAAPAPATTSSAAATTTTPVVQTTSGASGIFAGSILERLLGGVLVAAWYFS